MPDPGDRQFALQQAVAYFDSMFRGGLLPDPFRNAFELLHVAGLFYGWLTAPVTLTVTAAPLTYEQGPEPGPGVATISEGAGMVQLTDSQQVTLMVGEQDSRQNPVTGDTLAWTVDDVSVVSVTPDAVGYTALVVAGIPGSATVTVTDSTVSPPLVGTFQVTVVPGEASSLVISAGSPVEQPAPAG